MKERRVAAIFDVDGTLVMGRTLERTFYRFLVRMGELRVPDLGSWVEGVARGITLRENRYHLRGKSAARLNALARLCFDHEIKPSLLTAATDRVRLHRVSGHEIVLISGALQVLVDPLAELLGTGIARGTSLESSDGFLTGRIIGTHPYSRGKVTVLNEIQREFNFNLARSFAYANHHTDRYLLSSVGHAVAANPDRALRRIARSRGWMIEDFSSKSLLVTSEGMGRDCSDRGLFSFR